MLTNLLGGDAQRDKETFFLSLALEFGTPRSLEDLGLRGRPGLAKAMPRCEPDVDFVTRFAELAHTAGYTCATQQKFIDLYEEYFGWYRRNHPELF